MGNLIDSVYFVLFNVEEYTELYSEIHSKATAMLLSIILGITLAVCTSFSQPFTSVPSIIVKMIYFAIFFNYFPKVFTWLLVSQIDKPYTQEQKESLQYFIAISTATFALLLPISILLKSILSELLALAIFFLLLLVFFGKVQKGIQYIFALEKKDSSKVIVIGAGLLFSIPFLLTGFYIFILASFFI